MSTMAAAGMVAAMDRSRKGNGVRESRSLPTYCTVCCGFATGRAARMPPSRWTTTCCAASSRGSMHRTRMSMPSSWCKRFDAGQPCPEKRGMTCSSAAQMAEARSSCSLMSKRTERSKCLAQVMQCKV